MKNETFKCFDCGETKSFAPKGITKGYGLDQNNHKVCYDCCAKKDKEIMTKTGKISLYLTVGNGKDIASKVSNWPGTLSFHPHCVRKGLHNIAKVRYDVWFLFEGKEWHGVTYGDNTQICHCKRMKT